MKTNKKFAKKYLSFCKRVGKFSELKKDLDAEIEGINSLVEEPSVVNFSKRGNAKLRKFSEVLETATSQAEEIQDSAEDLVKEAEATNFAKISKVKILRREFSNLESELKTLSDDVKEVVEEAASEGRVTVTESAEPAQPGTEQPSNAEEVTVTVAATPAAPGVVEDASAEVTKKVSVNFSKDKYLSSKLKSVCSQYKNFSEDFENSGDIIEEITDEVTLDEAPTAEEVKPTEENPTEEIPTEDVPEVTDADKVAEVAEGIAEDVEGDDFNEEEAIKETETTNFSSKNAMVKIIKAFSRIKKHFDEKLDAIKKDLDSTKVVDSKDLTSEEAESLTSEFNTFTETNESKLTKRLSKKFSNFSVVMKKFSDGEVMTPEVVEAAEDVADAMDAVEESPAEFKEFSKKIRKFVKLFSVEARPTPEEVISENPTEEVAVAASEEVVKKDAELNSTLDTINGKIENLDLPANVTNFAKMSSKSLSMIKCFSDQDVDNKLKLIEEFAEMCKEFCDKKNMSEVTPTEEVTTTTETPTEEVTTTETPTEEVTTEEVSTPTEEITEEFSDDDDELEEVVVDETAEEVPVPTEEVTEEVVNEEKPVPSDDEVILKNFSARKGAENNSYGSMMANLAIMH